MPGRYANRSQRVASALRLAVPEVYQAAGLLSEAGTVVQPPNETPLGSSPDQGAAEKAKQPQARAILPDEVGEQHSDPARKRRKKTVPDPQAQGRQLQAQQRHNVWQPTLLAARRRLQHICKQQAANSLCCSLTQRQAQLRQSAMRDSRIEAKGKMTAWT